MPTESNDSSERERRVADVLAGYFAAVEAGAAPDRQALLAQHPDLAAELAEYFEEEDRFARMVQPLRSVAAAAEATACAQESATLGPEKSATAESLTLGPFTTTDAGSDASEATAHGPARGNTRAQRQR